MEIDTETHSAYVRFTNNKVVRTVSQDSGSGPVIAIDLDQANQVVGIELIGVQEFGIRMLLMNVRVSVNPSLLDKARYVAAQKVRAMAAA